MVSLLILLLFNVIFVIIASFLVVTEVRQHIHINTCSILIKGTCLLIKSLVLVQQWFRYFFWVHRIHITCSFMLRWFVPGCSPWQEGPGSQRSNVTSMESKFLGWVVWWPSYQKLSASSSAWPGVGTQHSYNTFE